VRARSYDVIVVGGGIIGISLALELRKQGERVIVLDKGEPGREASYASAGMLASRDVSSPPQLSAMAAASAAMYPEFVAEVEAEGDAKADFRREGAVYFSNEPQAYDQPRLSASELRELEPEITYADEPAYFSKEDWVDPHSLMPVLVVAARRRGIEFASNATVTQVAAEHGKVMGVKTELTSYASGVVVNCCGAWAEQLKMRFAPVRPVKGHMLSLLPAKKDTLRHVVRSRALDVYLLPRSSGMIAVGSTIEDAGFDKNVNPDTILRLHQLAANLVPELGEGRIHESWTGLRPGTPDELPILGEGEARGYFIATGHFRNGILLAPITARVMTRLINRGKPEFDLTPFAPSRFG
jgi:glycine oxidase